MYGETGIGKNTIVRYLIHYLYERKIFNKVEHELCNNINLFSTFEA